MEKNKAQNPAKKDKEVSLRVKTGYKMAKKETKPEGERIEREYIINLRSSVGKVPIYRRTPKAVKSIKEFLARHMKVYDRDLNNFRLLRNLGVLSVGVMITRLSELQTLFDQLGKGASYGRSTTHWDKLMPRVDGGGAGGCPLLLIGMGLNAYRPNE